MRLNILDSATELKAWGGVIDKKIFKKNCNTKFNSDNESFVKFFFETLLHSAAESSVDKAFGTYPEAPSVQYTVKKILTDFTKSIPVSR